MPKHQKKQSTTTQTQTTPPVKHAPEKSEEGPVSKALDAFARAEPGVIEAAAGAYIKRTDKVKDKQLVGDEDHGIKGSGSHESALQAVAYTRIEAVTLADQYALLVDAGIVVGGSLQLKGELEVKYGKLSSKVGASLTLFGGAMAKISGRAQIGSNGLVLQGKGEAFVGARGKGSVEGSFDVGSLGLGSEIEVEGKAGAWGEAEGEISFSKESIAVSGSAKAFAGIEGTVEVTSKARLYGRDAFTAKVGATGQLGVGGEIRGGFKIRGGKIELNLDAKGALGMGGGGEVDLTADLKPVAVWAWRQYDKAKWSLRGDGKGKGILDNPQQIVDPLTKKVSKYAQTKIDALHLKKAENFVKIEKLQAYVGEVCPRKEIKGRPNATAIDAYIKQAIEAALLSTTKVKGIVVTVKDGKLENVEGLPEADELAAKFATKSKTGEALGSIISTGD